jgi:hypothetical protein
MNPRTPTKPRPGVKHHPTPIRQASPETRHASTATQRVLLRLHDGGEHAGRITRRTKDGLVLDTGEEIPVARVCAITAAPLQPPVRDRRDRRLAACAHTFGYRGHCLTKSRRYSTTFGDLRQGRADHVRDELWVSCHTPC